MAFSVTNIGTNTGATVTSIAVTVGAAGVPAGVVIFALAFFQLGNLSASDSASNTYTLLDNLNPNSSSLNGRVNTWHADNVSALVQNNTITVSSTGSSGHANLSVCYITGAATASPVDTAVSASAMGSSTTPSVTGGTASVAGELNIGIVGGNATVTITQASGWTTPPNTASQTSAFIGGGNQVNSGTAGLTFNPTLSGSSPWAAAIYGFKPAAGVLGMPRRRLRWAA